jgi:hypothetical protein
MMAKKRKKGSGGYHIAKAVGEPQRLLSNQGSFTLGDPLLFITPYEAAEYIKVHGIASALIVIVPCECSDTAKMRHTYVQ